MGEGTAHVVWVLLDMGGDAEAMREAATSAIETGVDGMLVGEGETELVSSLSRLPVVERRGDRLFEEGARTGDVVEVASKGDVERAIGLLGKGRVVLIETPDWTVIPLEDLVAARHGESLSGLALALVDGVEDARLALGALEHGVDGVVVRIPAGSDVRSLVSGVRGLSVELDRLGLSVGTVVRVEELGLGDRACVDTVDILREGEGLLVGSSSGGFLLVHGETVENPYAAVRPFRVNAGAVHSYVLAPGGRTLYLSEAMAGIRVLLVDREGATRASHVGRLKIERRPLVLVEVEASGRRFNAILQNAETVRLVTPGGHASVSGLEEGQKVIVHLVGGGEDGVGAVGRHFGRAVPERIVEG